jgi:excisionase family DNA binding protein
MERRRSMSEREIKPMREEATLTIREAADILGIHPTDLARVAQAGYIPYEREKGYRFKKKDVEDALPNIAELASKARKALTEYVDFEC